MTRRTAILYAVLAFLVALAGTFVGLQIFRGNTLGGQAAFEAPRLITVPVIITATSFGAADDTTPVETAVPPTIEGQVELPEVLRPTQEETEAVVASVSTPSTDSEDIPDTEETAPVDAATSTPAVTPTPQATATLDSSCPTHTVEAGQNPSIIAAEYDISLDQLLVANGLDEVTATQLQIGDILSIPLAGCDSEPSEVEIDVLDEATEEPTAILTLTLPPTSEVAQVEILDVIDAGDVTAENFRIKNEGNTIEITGWKLKDLNGNEFEFPEVRLFSDSELTIHTRDGEDSSTELFWGLEEAIGVTGNVLTLTDADDNVQSVLDF